MLVRDADVAVAVPAASCVMRNSGPSLPEGALLLVAYAELGVAFFFY
jgi:hypothetical protein